MVRLNSKSILSHRQFWSFLRHPLPSSLGQNISGCILFSLAASSPISSTDFFNHLFSLASLSQLSSLCLLILPQHLYSLYLSLSVFFTGQNISGCIPSVFTDYSFSTLFINNFLAHFISLPMH